MPLAKLSSAWPHAPGGRQSALIGLSSQRCKTVGSYGDAARALAGGGSGNGPLSNADVLHRKISPGKTVKPTGSESLGGFFPDATSAAMLRPCSQYSRAAEVAVPVTAIATSALPRWRQVNQALPLPLQARRRGFESR